MNKQEVIDKLREHGAWCTECHDINGKKDIYVKAAKVRELLEQLEEPQAEKVVVPDFIAKLICKYKAKKETLVCSIANLYRESDEYKWYVDNAGIYERAWVNGYTVKPKRWVVRFNDMETYFYFIGWSDIFRNDDNPFVPNGHLDKSDDSVFIFTDKSKAEAVATLVEGSVEEV